MMKMALAMTLRHVEACDAEAMARAGETNRTLHSRAMAMRAVVESAKSGAKVSGGKVFCPFSQAAFDLRPYSMNGSVAVVPINGPLFFDGCSSMWGPHAWIIAALSLATEDPQVNNLVIDWNCPGGTCSGMDEIVQAVRAARVKMEAKGGKVVSLVRDVCCSGGYWGGSQASEVVATRTAEVGSIGGYIVLEDYSKAAEMAGVKVTVVNAGAFKGMQVRGVPVTPELIDEAGKSIAASVNLFVDDVAKGRGARLPLAKVQALADGRVYHAGEAVKLGLIDAVVTSDELMASLNAPKTQSKKTVTVGGAAARRAMVGQTHRAAALKGGVGMTLEELQAMEGGPELIKQIQEAAAASAKPKTDPAAEAATAAALAMSRPATLQELEAALPGADAGFVLASLKGNESTAKALSRYNGVLAAQLAEAHKSLATAHASSAGTAGAHAAVIGKLVGAGAAVIGGVNTGAKAQGPEVGGGDTADDYLALTAELTKPSGKEKGLTVAKAMAMAKERNPKAHAAWLREQRGALK